MLWICLFSSLLLFKGSINSSRTGSTPVFSFFVHIEVYNHSLFCCKKQHVLCFISESTTAPSIKCSLVEVCEINHNRGVFHSFCHLVMNRLSCWVICCRVVRPCSQAVGTEYLMLHVVGFSSINQSLHTHSRHTIPQPDCHNIAHYSFNTF